MAEEGEIIAVEAEYVKRGKPHLSFLFMLLLVFHSGRVEPTEQGGCGYAGSKALCKYSEDCWGQASANDRSLIASPVDS